MNRSRQVVWICGALALGCAAPRERVYVDLDLVLAAEQPELSRPAAAAPKFESISESGTLPRQTGRTVADARAAQRLVEAEKELDRQRLQVVKQIGDQLLKAYANEVDRFRLEENAKIETQLRSLFEAIGAKVRALLERYAERRWPVANRLALLVGFPFPPESRLVAPDPEDRIGTKRHREAISLYSQLRALQAEFDSGVGEVLDAHFADSSQLRLELGLKVVERMNEAERRARSEAERAVSAINHSIEVSLTDLGRIRIPELPSRIVAVEARGPFDVTGIGAEAPMDSIISRRRRIESDLEIWLGANAYLRSSSKARARDATESFIQWRRTMGNSR